MLRVIVLEFSWYAVLIVSLNDYLQERKHSTNEVCAFEQVASICEKGTGFKKTPKSSEINF